MDVVGNRTVRDLWEELARDRGEHTFLIFRDRAGGARTFTYAQFGAAITRTANLLRSLGVGHGDAVAVHAHNCPELLQVMFATAETGAILVPLHPRSSYSECKDMIGRVPTKVVICEPELAGRYTTPGAGPLTGSVTGFPSGSPGGPQGAGDPIVVPQLLVARGEYPQVPRFETERDRQPAQLSERVPLSSDDVAGIVFTSGSTARSKGVLLTHANLLFSGIYVNWQAAMRPDDRLLTTMPACHVNFQLNALMPVLTAGATLIAVEKFSASNFWRQVCADRATMVQSIAMMVRTMLLQPQGDWERHNHVREVLYYLPISDAQKVEFESRFATRILNSYGNSEMLVGVITDPPFGERRWPSIGRVGIGYEARVADAHGRPAPPHQDGEIQVRGVAGRTLMRGYHDAPQETAALYDADGWMRTGDIGHVDDDGWFYFVDRRTRIIKRSGENVSPAEVEAVLVTHPDIAEAAVIGVPDPIHDQAVKAIVVPRPGAALTPDGIREFAASRLAPFKVPTLVEVVPALPRTGSYKVATSALT